MKRRRFLQAAVAAPAVPALVAQQPPAPPTPPAAAGRGAGGRGMATSDPPHIALADADDAAVTVARFFNPAQFAALRKLAGLLVPPMKGAPGALDSDAVEFIDFLVSKSPAATQALYRNGLDALNASARRQFAKPFADLDNGQADTILKPLVVPVAWAYDPPKDPVKHFIYQAHQDLRTATRNSPDAARAMANSGRRGFAGAGLYWHPIDPA